MTREELLKKISELESMNDQLLTEIRYLNEMLKKIGFDEGIKTLKMAIEEIIEQDKKEE